MQQSQSGQPTDPSQPRPQSVGPGRKLPTIPPPTGEGGVRGPNVPKNGQNGGYGPFFLEYTLMAEYQLVKKTKPSGIYVIPSARCPLIWNGVIFIRQGLYQGAVFRFNIHIPDNFPDGDCPTVVLNPLVFHPLVHPVTGELDIQRAFEKWRRNYNRLWQVVHYVRKVFYKIETSSPANPEAAVLYDQNQEVYKSQVLESIEKCKALLYDDPDPTDPHAIRFSELNSDQLDQMRSKMLKGEDSTDIGVKTIETLGLTWMSDDSCRILDKQEFNSN